MIEWSVKHKSILALLTTIVIIFGTISYIGMEREENPAISSPVALIKSIYPGASPEDIEKLIVKPIEDALNEIPEIKTLESFSMDSIGVIKITLKDMSDAAMLPVWDKVREDLDNVKADLPSSAYDPTIETDFTTSYSLIMGLTSKDYTYENLSDAAYILQEALSRDPGVKAVDIDGEIGQEIAINLDMTKLSQYGISPTTVGTALKARNINIPGGNLELDGAKVPVQISGEYKSVDEIKNTIVSVSETGTPVYLKDVANITQDEEKKEIIAAVNGEKAVLIGVKYMEGENILKIQERLQVIIDDYKEKDLYTNMELIELNNQATFVDDAIDLFANNLISAILLVLVVVLITMGIRSAVIVTLPIPIVICLIFAYMKIANIPLHQVSIASLIISLSLLVANGIVANDNMNVYLEQGKDKMTACTQGIEEVKIPILTSTLTTVASFLPLAMMVGSAGKFVKTLPILVTVALIGSYITSLTIVPAVGYLLLEDNGEDVKKESFKDKVFKKLGLDKVGTMMIDFYAKILYQVLKMPRMIILSFVALLIFTLTIIPTMDIQLFPPVERDQYVLDISIKDGSDASKMEQVANEVSDILSKEESVNDFGYKAGDGFMKYYVSFIPNDLASNKAQFLINGDRNKAQEVEKRISEEIPGVSLNLKQLEIGLPVTYPVQIRVTGSEITELRRMAEEIHNIVYEVEGTRNIEDDYGYDSYKLNIDVDEEKANMVGITNYDIAGTVRMAVNGLEVSELKQENIESDSIPMILKIANSEKGKREILDTLFFTSQITGENVPLNQMAVVDTATSLNKIIRRDAKRTITVGAFVQSGYNVKSVMEACQSALEAYELPDGYYMEFGGENESSSDAFSSMVVPTIIAIVLIYLILVFQFGDLTQPLIIMGTIPLSFIGIIWGLKWTRYPIGFMALLGAISLMGVVVNNGIVLLDYIGLMIKEYSEPKEAISQACKTRLRPIMIGMVTTVISLISLAATGGDLWAPMANAIIFGMLLSSVLTLIVIPCAYLIIFESKERRRNWFNSKRKVIPKDTSIDM